MAGKKAAGARTAHFERGDTPLTTLPGVGPAIARKLAARGLSTFQDLWLHLPLRYEDRTRLTPIRLLRAGEAAQVEGFVEAVERGFRYRPMLQVAMGDASQSTLVLRFFHFRAAQAAQFAIGSTVRVYGTPREGKHGLEIVHPGYRIVSPADTGALRDRLDPVYPAIDGVGAVVLARLIDAALQRLPDADALELLPIDALDSLQLPTLRDALLSVHRPSADADLAQLAVGTHPAQQRLAIEELLAHQLSLRRQRMAIRRSHAHALGAGVALADALIERLAFTLTAAQQRVLNEVRIDMARNEPMLRLVQGDVGSGKTVVAALAAAAPSPAATRSR